VMTETLNENKLKNAIQPPRCEIPSPTKIKVYHFQCFAIIV
jgi:hypothetical protein